MQARALMMALGIGLSAASLRAAAQPADDVFSIDGRAPQKAIVAWSVGVSPANEYLLATTMGRGYYGCSGYLEGERLRDLRACAAGRVDSFDITEPAVCHVHLFADDGGVAKVIEIARIAEDGALIAIDPATPERPIRMRSDRFEPLLLRLPRYRGGFDVDACEIAPGTQDALAQPYRESSLRIDRKTVQQRLYRGMNVVMDDADRDLAAERFHVRVPQGYDPRTPAPLLVWSSPSGDGRVPAAFAEGLDAIGAVCIGIDNAGNARDTQDKLQLHLDAVATARQRFHLDEGRIYVAGLSGGGKVSSIVTVCFPDIFDGAIAIAGLASHHSLDASWGEHRFAYFAPPWGDQRDLAITRPIAVMTGPADFNYPEMKLRSELYVQDGYDRLRFMEYSDMGHTLPTSQRFRAALEYIDERGREAQQRDEDLGRRMLGEYLAGRDVPQPRTEDDEQMLLEVIAATPWTGAAWRALDLLLAQGGPQVCTAHRRGSSAPGN